MEIKCTLHKEDIDVIAVKKILPWPIQLKTHDCSWSKFFWNKTFCGHKSPLKVQNLPNKDSNDLKVAHIKLKIHNLIHAFYYVLSF